MYYIKQNLYLYRLEEATCLLNPVNQTCLLAKYIHNKDLNIHFIYLFKYLKELKELVGRTESLCCLSPDLAVWIIRIFDTDQ